MDGILRIGIDGGGTLCRAAALIGTDRVTVSGPGANASSHLESCITRIRQTLSDLQAQAGLSDAQMTGARIYIGQAGVTGPEIAEQIAAALPYPHTRIEEDRAAAVVGALGPADGCLAAIGTGSFLARQAGGVLRYLGGYGLRLGDEASGAWLGREMLSAALRAEDGWGQQSPLGADLIKRYGGTSGLIAFGLEASPQALAELAPEVVAAAEAEDRLAVGVMTQGGSYIWRGFLALQWSGEQIVLAGGLGPHFAPWLPEDMAACLAEPQGTSLDGALHLAGQMP